MDYDGGKKLRSQSAAVRAKKMLVYVVFFFLALLSVFPFWFMFMNATWSNFDIQTQLRLYPGSIEQLVANYTRLTGRTNFSFPVGFKNSFLISSSLTILSVYFSSLTAFAIKVYHFKLNRAAFLFIIGVMMVPTQVSMIGFIRLMYSMNLMGSRWALIIPAIAAPATVFFVKQYLDATLSSEIVEAARIDGANEFYTFNRICLPIMVPAIATQGIFAFVNSWNNYLMPSLILTRAADKTLPLLVAELYGDRFTDYGQIYTGLSVATIPLIIVFAILQRYIIAGVSAGSVKE